MALNKTYTTERGTTMTLTPILPGWFQMSDGQGHFANIKKTEGRRGWGSDVRRHEAYNGSHVLRTGDWWATKAEAIEMVAEQIELRQV